MNTRIPDSLEAAHSSTTKTQGTYFPAFTFMLIAKGYYQNKQTLSKVKNGHSKSLADTDVAAMPEERYGLNKRRTAICYNIVMSIQAIPTKHFLNRDIQAKA